MGNWWNKKINYCLWDRIYGIVEYHTFLSEPWIEADFSDSTENWRPVALLGQTTFGLF